MIRFTVWLSDSERNLLRAMAKKYGTSQNYIARLAIREAIGLTEYESGRATLHSPETLDAIRAHNNA